MRNLTHRPSCRFAALLLLSSLCNIGLANGQDLVRDATTGETERVVVIGQSPEAELPAMEASTATRLPARILNTDRSVSVINRQTIQDRQIIDPQEAVQNVAGVERAGSYIGYGESFIVRGFQQQDIFKDGFRAGENASVGLSATGPTDISNIERIEVLKGPSAILYGHGEPGGTVNYITRNAYFANDIRVEQEFGSFDFYRTQVNANWNVLPNKLALGLDAAYQTSNSFIDFVHNERYFVAPSLLWQPRPDTTITFRGEYSHDFSSTQPGLPYVDGHVLPGVPYGRYLGEPGFTDFTTDAFRGLFTVEHKWAEGIVTTASFHARQASNDGGYVILVNFAGPSVDPVTGLVSRGVTTTDYSDENETVRLDQLFTWTIYQGRPAASALPAGKDGKDAKATARVDGGRGFPTITNQLLISGEYEREEDNSDRALSSLAPINAYNPVYTGYRPLPLVPFPGFPTLIPEATRTPANSFSVLLLNRISLGDIAYVSFGGRVEQFDADQVRIYPTTVPFPSANVHTSQLTFNPTAGLVIKPTHAISLYFNYAESTNSFQNLTALTANGEVIDPERSRSFEFGAKAELLGGKLLATAAIFQIEKDNVAASDPNNPLFSVNAGEQRSRGFEFELNGQPLPGWRVSLDYSYADARITEAPGGLDVGNRFFGVPYNSGGLFTTYEFQEGPLKGLGAGGGVFFSDRVQNTNSNTGTLSGWAQTDLVAFYHRGPFRAQLNVKNVADNEFYYATNNQFNVQPAAPRMFIGSVSVKF